MPMNLCEQLWHKLEEALETLGPPPDGFDAEWHFVKPAAGDKSQPAKELGRLARISARHHPPALFTQQSYDPRALFILISAPDKVLPTFEELYEAYVDKNSYLAECLLLLRPHCDVPYALFVSPHHFYLYDVATEDILRFSSSFSELEELLLQPMEKHENLRAKWDALARRSRAQRAEEFAHWFDLWRVSIGAQTGDTTSPELVRAILQKAILLFLYDYYFGFSDPDLQLRQIFLRLRQQKLSQPTPAEFSFDGVAWLHQASDELISKYEINFLRWTEEESAFISLMNEEARMNLRQFILELFFQSISKFDVEVQAEAFSDPDARLKMWKFSVTETLDVRRRMQADEINVYAPLVVDLDESGLAWTLHVVGEILAYWHEKCEQLENELLTRNRIVVQPDMFQHGDFEKAQIPTRAELFRSTLPRSLKIYYSDAVERQTLEYLVNLKIFEYCARHAIPLHPLEDIHTIFQYKHPH